ncbi:flagellar basal body rod protein FlgB [Psychrosphaera saromensis]|jgi:flagellar basal-body rod protein FlgB|uniref:Flagellar basal body rod protein FlgB n=1 Tax=Psychrosphaera saromensis TaxID=716813 RepID=A0A2S7UXZ5_9GAMM|nr:flagellar basal body rod protein FlgB [Psychrosphaera saromensis]PQJ54857.1 flagellar basal-body rod protein FlgB [Psychrosphaera saromensis]GHB56592.1 flagellar basal body rod protein FlgB [Psychrosphaera saromensis]GLQ13901.1 flagellar basal body rod protein FlgB [Psychrosphaera saromensis]
MAISLDKVFGIHQNALLVRSDRAELLSSNIANADTPGYKAKDMDFASALANAQKNNTYRMSKTHDKHFDLSVEIDTSQKYRNPNQPDTGDGNTVDVQVERNIFMQNSMEYQTSLEFLNGKIKSMNKALTGGN